MNVSSENELILLCSKGYLFHEDIERIRSILCDAPDWKEVLYHSVIHRQLNMVYHQLRRLDLMDSVDNEVAKIMRWNYEVITARNDTYLRELSEISDALNDAGVRAVALKGIMLSTQVYPAPQTRYFNDIDFLIKLSDAPKVTEVLYSLGYVQGQFDKKNRIINEVTRKQKIFHQLTTHELQEFLKIPQEPFVDVLEVDINHSILWVGNCPYSVDNVNLVERALPVEVNGVTTYMLNYEDGLVQLACHLFREATIVYWIKELRDLKIYKFADIYLYIMKFGPKIDWEALLAYVEEHNLNKILYYAFHYVNLMYGNVIAAGIMKRIQPASIEYLDEYGVENDKPTKWACDFSARLFDSNRVQEIYLQAHGGNAGFDAMKNQLGAGSRHE